MSKKHLAKSTTFSRTSFSDFSINQSDSLYQDSPSDSQKNLQKFKLEIVIQKFKTKLNHP